MNPRSSPSVSPAPHGGTRNELSTSCATAGGGRVACSGTKERVRSSLRLRGLAFTLSTAATAGSGFGQQFEAFHILPPDTASPTGYFGQRVAVDPPWAAVADRGESDVFMYELTPTGWRHTQSILEGVSNFFGDSMAIDGDTLVIGSPSWDYLGERKGKAFVYERDGAVWRRVQELQPAGLRWGDLFGDAVAIDGDVLVAGAPNVASPGFKAGAVFIYERNGTAWDLAAVFRHDPQSGVGTLAQTLLGRAVAVSGRTVVAAAEIAGASEGEVRVYERGAAGWRLTAVLADPTPTNADHLGKSVAIFGDTIVAGEGGQPTAGFGYKQGSALVFERDAGGAWQFVQEIEASDGFGNGSGSDLFGRSVAMERDRIAVAARNSTTIGSHNGAIYLFERSEAGTWEHHETTTYVASDPDLTSNAVGLGEDVALRDGFVFAGALSPFSAYVFEVESGTSYCAPAPNTSGAPGHLAAVFSPEGEGFLSVHDAPPSTLGAFLVSPNRDEIVFQPSSLCLGAGMWRIDPIAPTGNAGVAIHELDLGGSSGLASGVTFYFQYWYEDSTATAGSFNFTNALAVVLP